MKWLQLQGLNTIPINERKKPSPSAHEWISDLYLSEDGGEK